MFFHQLSLSRNAFFTACLLVVPISGVQAENETADGREYQDIETVVVTAATGGNPPQRGTPVALPQRQIEFLRPTSLADIFKLVPAANVRVNSRGETLVSLRGSGERQLAVFFDGAPVNVPWDNRFDLRLVPALAIGSAAVATGPTTSGFGANTAGGVVAITSRSSMDSEVLLEGGGGGLWSAQARTGFASGKLRSLIAVDHMETDGIDAPNTAYTDGAGSLITNRDRKQTNVLVRTTGEGDTSKVGISVLYSNASYGIAPEQGPRVDPASARYWRFPDTEHLLVFGNYQTALSDTVALQGNAWHQSFDQRINSFEDVTYSAIEDIQQDGNNAYGARIQLGFEGEQQQLSLTATSGWASHKQQEFEPQEIIRSTVDFSQRSASFGADYSLQINPSTSFSLGASYDVLDPGKNRGPGQRRKI